MSNENKRQTNGERSGETEKEVDLNDELVGKIEGDRREKETWTERDREMEKTQRDGVREG